MNIVAAVIVLVLPGLAMLLWIERRTPDLFCRLADAVGLSVSLTALLGLVFFLLGLSPGWLGGLVFYAAALVACIAAFLRLRPAIQLSWRSVGIVLLGGALLTAAAIWRLYQARGLAFPAWVDSVQHTLIVRQIIETGGLPETLLPFLNAPFFYHYGFHIVAAAFSQWSGLLPDQAVLWLGQLINALVGLGVYRFSRSLHLSQRASLSAALLTGFVLQMPAYYLAWGRFTLLTGWVVLLPAMSAALEARRAPHHRGTLLRLGVLTAGLCLTHYLAVVVFLLFLGLLAAEVVFTRWRQDSHWDAKTLFRLALAPVVGGVVALPWLLRVYIYQRGSMDVTLPGEEIADWNYLNYLLGPRYNHILMLMAAVAFVLCASLLIAGWFGRNICTGLCEQFPFERTTDQGIFALWTLSLLLFSLPFSLRLGPFRPDHYVICLFFPASIWMGIVLANGSAAFARRWGVWAGRAALLLAVGLLVGWGLRESRSVLNPVTLLADRTDRAALDWINQNVPASAKFYINAAHWQNGAYRGVDGGAWLLPYTARGALVPPISYMWMTPEEYTQINRWARQTESLEGCTPDFWQLVREAGLTHVYLRVGRGTLQPEMLNTCPRLLEIYREGGVWIYEILLP